MSEHSIARATSSVPLDPGHDAWSAAEDITIDLGPQKMTKPNGGQALQVQVRLLASSSHLGIRLAWQNPTAEDTVGIRQFRDSCALMFPAAMSDPLPPFVMGGEGKPVIIWQWKPDWENPEAQEAYRDEKYPKYADAYNPHNERLWKDLGDRPRGGESANVVVAESFGTITRTQDPDLEVKSLHTGGGWQVVFRRSLPSNFPRLDRGLESAFNVAVWDGANDEVGCRKSISYAWHRFQIPAGAAQMARAVQQINPPMVAATLTAAGVAWAIRRRMALAGHEPAAEEEARA